MKNYKIFAVNPGSTSTKIALFEGDNNVYIKTVNHDPKELAKFSELSEELPYRMETIFSELRKAGISLEGTDAFAGRGGGLVAMESGTYAVNDILHEHARIGFTVKHPCTLGAQIARKLSQTYGGGAYVVSPPDVDELCNLARVTGLKGVYRKVRTHALNQKEVGIRYAASQNKKYEDMNLIICHVGGALSVIAHQQGRMIDSNDIAGGDGPMAPTRCGSISAIDIIRLCFSGRYTEKELMDKTIKTGGWLDHLGTTDGRLMEDHVKEGDPHFKLIYDATIYQVAKYVGSCAAVLKGKLDAIILTGGVVKDKYFTDELESYISSFAPVVVMAGEYELEALAAGGLRVLRGEEKAKEYTGIPVWDGFKF
jgi:butyrate kinase